MNISTFDDLLAAARAQAEPQRLLFVFAAAELADDSTEEQRQRFAVGEGGALVPVMTVDKAPDALANFAALMQESEQFGKTWVMVFAAAMSGRQGKAPAQADVTQALERMTEAIKSGNLSAFVPFDRDGNAVRFT